MAANVASAPVVGSFGTRAAAAAVVTGQQQAAANAAPVVVGHRSRLISG